MDTSYPDFEKPQERSLTVYNRIIKFKGDGIDLTGNRAKYGGKGENQVKITFSDTERMDIAASGDIHIGGQKTVLIQAKELPEEKHVQQSTEIYGHRICQQTAERPVKRK